jgi:hypothetical protein
VMKRLTTVAALSGVVIGISDCPVHPQEGQHETTSRRTKTEFSEMLQ